MPINLIGMTARTMNSNGSQGKPQIPVDYQIFLSIEGITAFSFAILNHCGLPLRDKKFTEVIDMTKQFDKFIHSGFLCDEIALGRNI
ncbi:hypothetical protein AB7W95_19815 [Providencia rettgeri]